MFENAAQIPSSLDGYFLKKSVRRCVYEFGIIMSGALGLLFLYWAYLGTLSVLSGSVLIIFGALFFCAGKYFPRALLHPWRLWMLLALLLSKVMTPVILALMWILVVTPFSIAARFFGQSPIDLSFRDDSKESHFLIRDEKDNKFDSLKRQF